MTLTHAQRCAEIAEILMRGNVSGLLRRKPHKGLSDRACSECSVVFTPTHQNQKACCSECSRMRENRLHCLVTKAKRERLL